MTFAEQSKELAAQINEARAAGKGLEWYQGIQVLQLLILEAARQQGVVEEAITAYMTYQREREMILDLNSRRTPKDKAN
jgi:hypothetical protein